MIIPGDQVVGSVLKNQSEYLKTVGNVSVLNKVYLAFYEGLQYSVLGPAHIPDDLVFQATSYGSHTECRMVTTQCGAESASTRNLSDFNFACNNTMAGLNMTGNFAHLGQITEGYDGEINYDSTTNLPIESVNTMSPSNFTFGFQYFYDSAMQKQVPQTYSDGLGAVENGPISNITNQYFWAFAFSLDIRLPFEDTAHTVNPWARLNLVAGEQGGAEGIMSCETNISEIVCLAYSPFHSPLPLPLSPYNCSSGFSSIYTNSPVSPSRPITCPNPSLPSSPPPYPARTPPSPSSTASLALLATNNSFKALRCPS